MWMDGLIYAENQGAKNAYEDLMRNAFDYDDFEFGVLDYIRHYESMANKKGHASC